MHISTAHYRQDFDLICAHALERQVKSLVGVDVRKNKLTHELIQMLGSTICCLSFERREVDHPNHTSSIRHQACWEFTRTDPFQGFSNRDLAWQQLGGSVHDSSYLALTAPVARLSRRQVYSILYCQGFIDGLPLQS